MTLLGWVLLGVYVAGLLPAAVLIVHVDDGHDGAAPFALFWPVVAVFAAIAVSARWIERKLWKHS